MSRYLLHTRSLTLAEIRLLLDDSIGIFGELGVNGVEIQFGWACSEAVQWTSRQAAIGEVVSILQEAIIEGHYELGEADVSLVAKDRGLEISLCHESDVHAETEDQALIEAIETRWVALGFKGYTSGGPEKSKARFWGPPGQKPDSRTDREGRIRNDPERAGGLTVRLLDLSADELRAALKELRDLLATQRVGYLMADNRGAGGSLDALLKRLSADAVAERLAQAQGMYVRLLDDDSLRIDVSHSGLVVATGGYWNWVVELHSRWDALGLKPLW